MPCIVAEYALSLKILWVRQAYYFLINEFGTSLFVGCGTRGSSKSRLVFCFAWAYVFFFLLCSGMSAELGVNPEVWSERR